MSTKKNILDAMVPPKGLSTPKGGNYALTHTQWWILQAFNTYNQYGLPHTDKTLATSLNLEVTELGDFSEIIILNNNMFENGTEFNTEIQPKMLDTALSLKHHAEQTAATYKTLGVLTQAFGIASLIDDTGSLGDGDKVSFKKLLTQWYGKDASAKGKKFGAAFLQLMGKLQNKARGYHKEVEALETKLNDYLNNPTGILACGGDYGRLDTKFDLEYGAEGTKIASLRAKLKTAQDKLKNVQKTIDNDKENIKISACFAWNPFGAGVLIGYEVDLSNKEDDKNKLNDQITTFNSEISTDLRFKAAFKTSKDQCHSMVEAINIVTPIVTKLKTVWHELANNIEATITVLGGKIDGNGKVTTTGVIQEAEAGEWMSISTDISTLQLDWTNIAEETERFYNNSGTAENVTKK